MQLQIIVLSKLDVISLIQNLAARFLLIFSNQLIIAKCKQLKVN